MGKAEADEEMRRTVLFLATNRYINGEAVATDGGSFLEVPGR
jgi:hypothetical protein